MKASLKFREEKSPLLRAKLPLTVAGFPLLSGIAVGHSQDLALHLGTSFEAGPSFKIAYKPNVSSSPFYLVLKTGFGLWGSPNAAAVCMTAECNLNGKGSPIFSVRVKPRSGDFSLRKHVKSVSNTHMGEVADGALEGHAPESIATTPLRLEKDSLLTPVMSRNLFHNVTSFLVPGNGISETPAAEKDKNWGSDTERVTGSNFSFKTEGLDKGGKGQGERKQNFDTFREHEADSGAPIGGLGDSGLLVDAPADDVLPEDAKGNRTFEVGRKHREPVPAAGRFVVDGIFRGWSVNAHSTLPLGKQAELKIQWGVKVPSDLFQSWDSTMSGFKVPHLFMEKISVESVNTAAKTLNCLNDTTGPAEYEVSQPLDTTEESRELSHVAAMCGSMKRHLHLLNAENEVLKRAMKEMKSEFEYRGSAKTWKPAGPVSEILIEERTVTRPKLLDDPRKGNGREKNGGDVEGRKDLRDKTRKDSQVQTSVSSPDRRSLSPGGSDVLEELKKARMTAASSPSGSNGKNV